MKISRFLLASLIAVLFSSVAYADRIPLPVNFPTLGQCTGNSVRLREDPNTDSEILGKLNMNDSVVVLDKFITDGETWYEVDHPTEPGSAFVFGKYIEATFAENYQDNPLHKLIMNLYLTFGITPEKALKLAGKPKSREDETIGGSDGFERVRMEFNDFRLEYVADFLMGVSVDKGKKSFGAIKIGDSAEKVINTFGTPTDDSPNNLMYQESEMVYINFELQNRKVSHMHYQVYYDIEE